MAIGTDYPTPVNVNGYSCKNCTDVGYAKKHIDPAHPRSGPYGINAKDDTTARKSAAVVFGGALSALNDRTAMAETRSDSGSLPAGILAKSATGTQLDLQA